MDRYISRLSEIDTAESNNRRNGGDQHDIQVVANAWNKADKISTIIDHTHPNDRNFHEEAFWDQQTFDRHAILDRVLDLQNTIPSKELPSSTGIERIRALIQNKDFPERKSLALYLGYRLWLADRRVNLNNPYPNGIGDPHIVAERNRVFSQLMPEIKDTIKQF
jgi:hypothetical protein